MRLWTIQPSWVWERLCEQRTLLSDPTGEEFFQGCRGAHEWMRGQMRRRVAGYAGHYPWWAYEHKVHLRSHSGDGVARSVRLELAVPPGRVLLSAYGAWHFVLGYDYLPQSVEDEGHDREADAWEKEIGRCRPDWRKDDPLPEPWHSRMTASWERIFDVDDLRATNTIQACLERLDVEDVVRVTTFTPHPPPKK